MPVWQMREENRCDDQKLGSSFLVNHTTSQNKLADSVYDGTKSCYTIGEHTKSMFLGQKAISVKPGGNLRHYSKNSYKVPLITPKTELERVEREIKASPMTSLEPLDVKQLIKGFTRDTDKK